RESARPRAGRWRRSQSRAGQAGRRSWAAPHPRSVDSVPPTRVQADDPRHTATARGSRCGRAARACRRLPPAPAACDSRGMVSQFVAFLGVSALVMVTPGPDTALTIRNTLLGGRRGGVATALGVAAGQATWTLATSAGI